LVFRAKVDESVGSQTPATGNLSESDDRPKSQTKGGIAGYAALTMVEDTGIDPEDPEEDFGGLMVPCCFS
jgi:hypothetical protein